ncbi:MAG: FMN-binding protein, partial [Clostridium celatum]|nr:FMN-binding protein [Clostridium celatum]
SNINNTPPSSDNAPSTPSNPPSAPNDTPSNEPTGSTSSIYKDGVYEGTGSGYNGNITVKVTIKNDVITNLVVIDTVDNSPFVDTAISGIFDAILNSQSPDVDTVSGATFSSKGLISAVKAALKNAKN